MPSPLQYTANRLNAEKSQGPTSPQGRARSSMNALRHGLIARLVVLSSEDMAAYKAFSKEIVDSLNPQTPVERQFAQTVADNQWRINRIRSIEDGMLSSGHFRSVPDYDTASPEFHSAMTAARAIRLLKMKESQCLPYDPKEDGFVYSSAEIAAESARRDRFEAAKQAEKKSFKTPGPTPVRIPVPLAAVPPAFCDNEHARKDLNPSR
jgi:hypothetical protein